MYLNQFRSIQPYVRFGLVSIQRRCYEKVAFHRPKLSQEMNVDENPDSRGGVPAKEPVMTEMYPKTRVTPTVQNKEPIVLSFDDVPGPKAFKYVSNFRQYISELGTQLTVGILKVALNVGSYLNTKKPLKNLSALFDEYGPVVRFVSPVGGDIVLINHPEHIQKVYAMEGEYPIRSTLDSLEKYRSRHRNMSNTGGLFSVNGEQWNRQRSAVLTPLNLALKHQMVGINDVCEHFAQKIYNIRNHQDEVSKDLYKELHKWAFDSMGLVLFAKRFTMLDTELVYSQCDMSWLYHSLEKATDAIIKCESGLHFWKVFSTPSWNSLVKYCDSLDNLIGKHVIEAETAIACGSKDLTLEFSNNSSLINAMLTGEDKLSAEDIVTVIMDMLLIGVNTITSSMSFLLYYLAKYQRAQKVLSKEIDKLGTNIDVKNMTKITELTPYLQACIKEALRLAPPIPVLTRILPKNITIDKYNIPRGTLIIMSTQDASLKEGNYDDAAVFYPERWLKEDSKEYHSFASIPFGFGARKCLGQNISEVMMSLLTIQIIQKFKLEYHYGDIGTTRSFISKPNKALRVRFVDRV